MFAPDAFADLPPPRGPIADTPSVRWAHAAIGAAVARWQWTSAGNTPPGLGSSSERDSRGTHTRTWLSFSEERAHASLARPTR
eukprot:scaffold1894_cov48-Phaeocystis_antarctica.AAC.1